MWGAVSTEGGEGAAVGALGRQYRRAVQERQGLDSLAQVRKSIHPYGHFIKERGCTVHCKLQVFRPA